MAKGQKKSNREAKKPKKTAADRLKATQELSRAASRLPAWATRIHPGRRSGPNAVQASASSSVTVTSTCMLRADCARPMNVPYTAAKTCSGCHAIATRMRLRLPMILLVGSKSTHPAPGR